MPEEYRDKIVGIEKYCTKPELEMLLIVAEGLTAEYEKVKSKIKPKNFAKMNIFVGHKKYDNSAAFYSKYFADNPKLLVKAVKDYKRYNGSHNKDEHYLEELLK